MHSNKEVSDIWVINQPLELCHYGKVGMRWGIINKEKGSSGNKSPTSNETADKKGLTTKNKIAIGAAVAAMAVVVIGGMYVYKKGLVPSHVQEFNFGKNLDVSAMSGNDTIIKKGSTFHRVSSKSIEDYAADGKKIYVSQLKKDARLYKMIMPDFYKRWDNQGLMDFDGKSYEHLIKTNTDIKIPSQRKIADIYMQVTKNKVVDDGHYKNFMASLVNDDIPEVNSFLNSIRNAGYNALIDENDAGSLSKMPLILLNPKKDILSSSAHKIGAAEKIINVLLT